MKLTCEAVEDLYVLYQEDDLHPSVKQAIEEHLENCNHCKQIYRTGDHFSKTDQLKQADESITPSKTLDNQIKTKLKLRRMRFVLLFMIFAFVVYTFFGYVDKRKSLLYEVSSIEETVRDLYMQLGMDRWEGDVRFITSSVITDLNEKTTRLERYLNLYEKSQLNNHPYQLSLNFNLTNFIEVLYQRYQYDEWSERDQKAFTMMETYLDDITRLLTDQRLNLNDVDLFHPSALVAPFDGEELKELLQQIDHFAYTYGNFQQFPNEVQLWSRDEIKEQARTVFQESEADVTIEMVQDPVMVQSFGTYNTTIKTNNKTYSADWEAYTGRLLEFNSHRSIAQSGALLEESDVRNDLKELLPHWLGTDEFWVDYMGINYHYSSNMEDQLYSYHVIPMHDGFETNAKYRVFVDARTGAPVSLLTLEQNFYSNLSFASSEINVSKQEGLEQIESDPPYVYQQTIYVPSVLTNQYELVHQYESKKENDAQTILINARTGEAEVVY